MRFKHLILVVAVLMLGKVHGRELPPFLQERIEEYEAASEGRWPFEIWQYEYRGERVFYLPLSRILCCDVLSILYDAEGEVICRPEGGFTGRGDGRCPDFDRRRSVGVLVWNPGR